MNDNEKIHIKLERHKWPDEIEKETKKRRTIVFVVAAMITTFFVGWQANNLLLGSKNSNQSYEMSRFETIYNDILQKWYFTKDMENPEETLMDNAIIGMIEKNGDPHTSFMTAEESQSFSESINMNFVGIGVRYFDGGDINIITDIFKDSPAEKAGLQAGDIIQKVDGITINAENSIQDMVLGEAGTIVNLEILRNGEVININIVRAQVSALASGYMVDENTAYYSISSFGQNLGEITENYLSDFIEKGAKNLILDLRDNGGGLLEAVNDLSKIFLKDGDIVYQEVYTNGMVDTYRVKGSISEEYPLEEIVILINENSASASEVLTMALKENRNAKVVGRNSYGKGTVQVSYAYSDKSALKVTIAEWKGPNGDSIHGVGIAPDIGVDLEDIFYTSFVDMEDAKTVSFDTVDESVIYVQRALKYLKYHSGRTDGYFDSSTLEALNAFKKSIGSEPDGIINQDTIASVYSAVVRDWSLNRKDRDVQLHKAIESFYE